MTKLNIDKRTVIHWIILIHQPLNIKNMLILAILLHWPKMLKNIKKRYASMSAYLFVFLDEIF